MTSTLTTVLARGTPTSQGVLDILHQWSTAELVRPFLWIDVDQADLDSPFAPIMALRVSPEVAVTEDLLGHLARGLLDCVRVVVLETIGGTDGHSADFLQRCHDLVDRVGPVLPVSIGANGAPLTRLDTCRLVVPTSEAATQPLSTMDLAWTRTVVVSPEFRASPDSVPEYVREDNLASHAAAHVAAIGGLWEGMDGGVLDEDLSGTSSTGYQTVLVSRAFARIIRTDGMAEALAHQVAKAANGEAPVPFGVETGTVPAQDDERMVAMAVGMMNKNGQFDFSVENPGSDLDKRTAGWRETVIHVIRFVGSCLRLLVTAPLAVMIHAAEKGTTALTYGTGGTTEVKFRPKDEHVLEDGARQLLNDQLKNNATKIDQAESQQHSPSTPALWQRLRELSFGLVDGAHLADVKFPQNPDGRVDVVRRRGSVVAPPFPSSVPSAGTVELLGKELLFDGPAGGRNVNVALLVSAGPVARSRLQRIADEDASRSPSGASDGEELGSSQHHDVADPALPAAAGKRIATCREVALLEALLADAEHVARHQEEVAAPSTRRSMHARLMAAVDTASQQAHEALKAVTSPIDWNSLKPNGVNRQRRIFFTGSYLGIAVWVAFVAYSIVAAMNATPFQWSRGIGVARGFVALALLVLTLCLFYFQAVSRFNRQVEQTLHRLIVDGDRVEALVHERARLQNLATQLRDWSSVIARVVHEPVAVAPPRPDFAESAIQLARELPAEVAVTVRPQLPPSRRQLQEFMGKELGRGWLSRTFQELIDQAAYSVERPAAEFLLDADSDVPSAPNGARTELLHRLRCGTPQRDVAQALLARAATVALARKEGGETSCLDNEYLDAITGQPTAFVQYPFTASGLVAKSFEPQRSIVWAPIGTAKATGSLEVRVIDRVVLAGRSYDISIRCDVSGELDPRHMHLFNQGAAFAPVLTPEEKDRY